MRAVVDEVQSALGMNFLARRAQIGDTQTRILDHITRAGRIAQRDLQKHFSHVHTHIYYRLEVLRLLGFVRRVYVGQDGELPTYEWELSEPYRRELQR